MTKFTAANLKTLAWPKDATHVRLTHGSKIAVVARKDVVETLKDVEGDLAFGILIKKAFAPFAVQPESPFKAAEATKPASTAKPDAKPAAKSSSKKSAAKSENGASKGALGELFGFSVVSVLRRLGKAGVTTGEAQGILEAKKIKASPTTISIQVNAGRTGKRGEPAALTGEQLASLKALIK